MIHSILWPLEVAVAWIMVQFHTGLHALGLPSESGLTWALSIVGLVIVIRILLIPLFVKQIKASRGMQLLAPEMQVIQKKYKGKTDPASREAMSRETMELYKKHGTNPFSSCLPILAQSPIFFALFQVLISLKELDAGTFRGGDYSAIGPLTQELAHQANNATIFGAKISETFLGSSDPQVKVVTVALILLMSATTFFTQRQLTQKNMPASALQGPMAQQQKMLLYILPLVFAVSGVNFPIGVLIYWSTTNIWSMGQQFYVIRRNPTPGSEAERLLKERRARKAAAKGIVLEEERPAIEERPRGQREQPKRKARVKPPTIPGGPGGGAGRADDTQADDASPQDMAAITESSTPPVSPTKSPAVSKKTPSAAGPGGAVAGKAATPRKSGGSTADKGTGSATASGTTATGGTPAKASGSGRSGAPAAGGAAVPDGTTAPRARKPRTPKK